MFMTLLGMVVVYTVGAGIVVLLGMAMQHDKNERTK
jgi:hypothetical protein